MATSYTSTFQVINDLDLYSRVGQKQSFTLGNFPAIAQNRWVWIFNNWTSKFRDKFKNAILGNGDLQKKFDIFQRFISSWALGNTNNPLASSTNFATASYFLDLIPLSSLQLDPSEISLANQEIARVSAFLVQDFEAMISFIRKQQSLTASILGLGDADASTLTGIGVGIQQRQPTIEDLIELEELDELIKYTQTIILNLQSSAGRQPNILARNNQFVDPVSNVSFVQNYLSSTPIPFEISLQHMAKKYLGSQDRWYELVTINNLLPPYEDEVGTKYALLAPPAANNLIIPDTQKNDIAVGIKVNIGSYRYAEEQRIIENIIFNSNGTMILFLSGAQNLTQFKPSEGAFVRIYAPQTTRKGQFVLIPSTTAAPLPSPKTPQSDALRQLDTALLDFGVDVYINDLTNDLVFDASGNFQLASGFINVKQAALNALKTIQGELVWHPTYGVNADVGGRFFGSTDEILVFGQLLRETLLQDPRFTNVLISNVSTTGTGIAIGLEVQIAGTHNPIPLNFVS